MYHRNQELTSKCLRYSKKSSNFITRVYCASGDEQLTVESAGEEILCSLRTTKEPSQSVHFIYIYDDPLKMNLLTVAQIDALSCKKIEATLNAGEYRKMNVLISSTALNRQRVSARGYRNIMQLAP